MKRLTLSAPAKINWSLAVKGTRSDGYHLLRSLMQSVSLYDTITLEAGGNDCCVCQPELPDSGINLAWRAWLLLRDKLGLRETLSMRIEKRIPLAAGLAGGSMDAAAVLLGANQLFGLGLGREALCELGLQLGADLPFCLNGGFALVQGIGEFVTPLPPLPQRNLVLANPGVAVSTAAVYQALDQSSLLPAADLAALEKALRAGVGEAITANLSNHLEAPACQLYPQIAQLKAAIATYDAPALMSGSGGTIWLLTENAAAAARIAADLGRTWPFAAAVHTLDQGVVIA